MRNQNHWWWIVPLAILSGCATSEDSTVAGEATGGDDGGGDDAGDVSAHGRHDGGPEAGGGKGGSSGGSSGSSSGSASSSGGGSGSSSGSASSSGGSSGSSSGSASSSGGSSGGSSGSSSGSSSGGGSSGSSGSSSGGGSGGGGDAGAPTGLFDPARVTTWQPGILADTALNLPLSSTGLPVRTTVCKTLSPSGGDDTSAINAALSACPANQVVALAAGTFTVSSTITLSKSVVLRGAGSKGAPSGTTIKRTGGGSVLAIGSGNDSTCYSGSMGTAVALTQDALKETSTIHVGASAKSFTVGGLALIDQLDDSTVIQGDGTYFKRVSGRSITERVEIAAVDATGGTITLSSPLHFTFKSSSAYQAMITPENNLPVKWAGIETLAIQGGSNPGYDGQMAGGIEISNAAYSWVADVQTDGTIGGTHVQVTGGYRVVVRDGWFHNSANYGFGTDCYGVVLRCGTADGLVENNIVRFMNKPILFSASGGGNVVAYNYADNSWATPATWQEVNIDTHCSFPHMELIEGNYAPHVGAGNTHGNSGYLTFYRNYSSSQFAGPDPVNGSTSTQNGNVTSIESDTGDYELNAVGNVLGSSSANSLGTAEVSSVYFGYSTSTPSIILFGSKTDVSYTSFFWHGNYDTVNKTVEWNPSNSVRTLPASLYRTSKPAWWPANTAWPWAGSDLTPMVGTLPAKSRSDTL